MIPKPVALSCGEPAGIGRNRAESLASSAEEEVLFWMGEPASAGGARYEIIDTLTQHRL